MQESRLAILTSEPEKQVLRKFSHKRIMRPHNLPSLFTLVDLHNIFVGIPSIGRDLVHAQKMLYALNREEIVDSQLLSEVCIFRIAVEGLRIALNNAGPSSVQNEFSDLPVEDKSHALLAHHALKSQTKKFKSVVAIVDASGFIWFTKTLEHSFSFRGKGYGLNS